MGITLREAVLLLSAMGFGAAAMDIWRKVSRSNFRGRSIADLNTLPINRRMTVKGCIEGSPHILWVMHENETWKGFLVDFGNEVFGTIPNIPDVGKTFHILTVSDGSRVIDTCKPELTKREKIFQSHGLSEAEIITKYGKSKYD